MPGFGIDREYLGYEEIYRRYKEGQGFAHSGGWDEQLWQHLEVIDLFSAIEAEARKDGNR